MSLTDPKRPRDTFREGEHRLWLMVFLRALQLAPFAAGLGYFSWQALVNKLDVPLVTFLALGGFTVVTAILLVREIRKPK